MNAGTKFDTSPKTILLGLDGGDLAIFDLFISLGMMPNFSTILAEGCRGTLISTVPPITAPAWTTMTTGLNPGKHGVFSFHRHLDQNLCRIPVNSTDVGHKRIWDYFSQQAKRVCVVNVPLTYPPSAVNGLMISGMLTPTGDENYTFPTSLKGELLAQCGEYHIDTPWHHYTKSKELIAALRANLANRRRAIEYLMAKEQFDFSMMVISSTDRLQHAFYGRICHIGERLRPSSSLDEEICQYYRDLDDFLGHLHHLYRDSHHIFIVSDHGFRPVHTKVNINRWLAQHGFFHQKSAFDGGWLRLLLRRLDILGLERLIRKTLPSIGPGRTVTQTHVDWNKTSAYSGAAGDHAVYLNVAGRDPQGIVTPGDDYERTRSLVKETLQSLVDHSRREKILDFIYTKEEVYRGKYLDVAPDLVLKFRPGYVVTNKRSQAKLLNSAGKQTGWHSMEGMFAASGAGIRRDIKLRELNLADLLPTILYSQNLPLLKEFDGQVREEMFSQPFQKSHQIKWDSQSTEQPTAKASVDENIIDQRLKALGYI